MEAAECVLCHEVETIEHVLFSHEMTSYVWFEIVELRIDKEKIATIVHWFEEMLQIVLLSMSTKHSDDCLYSL